MNTKIFDSLLEPIFVLNGQGQITYCNEPAAVLAGESARKIIRQKMKLTEVFTYSQSIEALSDLSATVDASPYQEVGFSNPEGTSGRGQITVQPVQLDSSTEPHWLVFIRDVTLEERLQRKYRAELEQKESVIEDLEKAKLELENYNKNLEKMVAERTKELSNLNQMLGALLDSLGQGFFIFDSNGHCLEVSTKACLTTLETDPRGQFVWDVLKIETNKIEGFKKWMLTAFGEMLPFEDLAPLAPQIFTHSRGLHIDLSYYPLRSPENSIEGIVVVATDSTELISAQREAKREREQVKLIQKLLLSKRSLVSFLKEAEDLQNALSNELRKPKPDSEIVGRVLHTLKGGAATFSMTAVADTCHQAEDAFAEGNLATVKKLELKIINQFSDFYHEHEAILGSRATLFSSPKEIPLAALWDFYANHVHDDTSRKQFLKSFLMSPAQEYLSHYDPMIQSLAEETGKRLAKLEIANGELPILGEAYASLFSTLVHAFRNAVDHGIEVPEDRLQAGKPEEGRIQVSLDQKDEKLRIQIKDDGKGIDPNILRSKLQSKGVDVSRQSDQEILQSIFMPSLSTKENVTAISGRGVGLDAVMDAAKSLGGRALVESTLGKGTTLVIEVPYLYKAKTSTPLTFTLKASG